jgi:hypothetical protein
MDRFQICSLLALCHFSNEFDIEFLLSLIVDQTELLLTHKVNYRLNEEVFAEEQGVISYKFHKWFTIAL